MQADLVVVGVLARIDADDVVGVVERLGGLPGVETFDLAEPERLGILIEATDVDTVHAILRDRIDRTAGVLGTWPVSMEMANGETTVSVAADEGPPLGMLPGTACPGSP